MNWRTAELLFNLALIICAVTVNWFGSVRATNVILVFVLIALWYLPDHIRKAVSRDIY